MACQCSRSRPSIGGNEIQITGTNVVYTVSNPKFVSVFHRCKAGRILTTNRINSKCFNFSASYESQATTFAALNCIGIETARKPKFVCSHSSVSDSAPPLLQDINFGGKSSDFDSLSTTYTPCHTNRRVSLAPAVISTRFAYKKINKFLSSRSSYLPTSQDTRRCT